jgi:hypothetical protein
MSEETTGTSAPKGNKETDHYEGYNKDNDTAMDDATASAAALIVAIMASKAAFRSTGEDKERVEALAWRLADSYPAIPVMLAALTGKFDDTEINPTVRSHNLQSQSV